MARIFKYGKLVRTATKTDLLLPGQFATAQGVQYGQGALATDGNALEFGEVVRVTGENNKSLTVVRAGSTLTLANAGFVVRDVVGQRVLQNGVVEEVVAGYPATVIRASAPQGWELVLVAGEDIEAGDTIHVGLGTGSTIAGAVYSEAKTTNTVELTGYKAVSNSFSPTTGAGKAVIVGKF